MKNKILLVLVGLLLSSQITYAGAIFSEDFTENPEWQSDEPDNVKWDSNGFYQARVTDNPSGFVQWGYSPLFEEVSDRSFTIEFDICPASTSWGTYPLLGLVVDGTAHPFGDIPLSIGADKADQFPNNFVMRGKPYDESSPIHFSSDEFTVGRWYHHKVVYNALSGILNWDISSIEEPEFHTDSYTDISVAPFNQVVVGYESTPPVYGSWAEIYVDNICIIPKCVPFSDDFEDGVIDANLWVVGGEKWGWQIHPPGDGSWTYSHEEIIDSDGYLQMRVEGPTSGNSYGADAWVRTVYNFNDGKSHLVNFTWEADVVIEGHYDCYHIHITDGNAPPPVGNHAWHMEEIPGTTNLLWRINESNDLICGWSLTEGMEPNSMSITITANGIARLYSELCASGELLHEALLPIEKPWYIQFLVIDATSSGFSAGDSKLNLYDFSANCVPRVLSPNGGEELIAGNTHTVTWEVTEVISNVLLEYSTNDGQDWNDVNTVPNAGSYDWLIPEVTSPNCLVRISDACDANIYDTSDDVFTIFQCLGPIPGDLDEDCYVNFRDFAIFAQHWLNCANPLDPACGIVAYWSFDEGSGTIAHDSTGNNDGILEGDPNWVDGISGKALYFDGNGDYVDVPDAPGLNPTSAITVAAWIKVSSFPGTWPPIVKKYDGIGPHHGYSLEFCGAGIHVWFLAQLEGGTGQTDYVQIQTPINRWHFVVAVYDGSAFTLYVDGVPSTPQNFTGNIVTSSYNLNIGRDPYLTNRFFHGVIDEVRIYNRALTAYEIQYLYENP